MSDKYISTPEACLLTGLSSGTLRRRVHDGTLPEPRRNPLDRRQLQWRKADIEKLMNP